MSQPAFHLTTYIMSLEPHPFDFNGGFNSIDELVEKLNSLKNALARHECNFNVVIQWNWGKGRFENDGEFYRDSIRIDPFVTQGRLSHCCGSDKETAKLITRAALGAN